MAVIGEFLSFLWTSLLLLGPMLLLGLLLAGVIHVLVSRKAIHRWLRRDSLASVAAAAAVGVPVPLCSCSVVPVVAEMRRKGASRSACMSFLITAPETGADSILVTHAFFGPLAAVARPFVSFVTAVATGMLCIGMGRRDAKAPPAEAAARQRDDCQHLQHHRPLIPGSDDCYVSPAQIWASARSALTKMIGRRRAEKPTRLVQSPDLHAIGRHVLRYGFVDVADDILFALLFGVALGGLLYLAVPTDLLAHEHARWLAYPAMVLAGLPLYICASASTPIAAALVAKGLSPGAALIFLMTGPATNTGTIAIVASQFGSRYASIYVGAVVGVTVALGVLIDVLLVFSGWSLSVNLNASDSPAVALVQWTGALGLIALIVWRSRAGALKSGYQQMFANLRRQT